MPVVVTTVPTLAAAAVVCAGVVIALLVALRFSGRAAADAGGATFLGIACAAAAVAAGSSAMYVAYLAEPSTLTLVIGDAAMALAPALFAYGLFRRGGGSAWWFVLPIGLAALCAVVTATVPQPPSAIVKIIAVGVGNVVIVAAAAVGRNRGAPGTRIMQATTAAYTIFCAARVIGAMVAPDSPIATAVLSTAPTTVAGVVAVLLMGWASVRLARAGHPRASEHEPPGARVRVWIEDAELLRDGLGPDAVYAFRDALAAACRANARSVQLHRDGVTAWVGEGGASPAIAAIKDDYAKATGVEFDGQAGSLRFAVE